MALVLNSSSITGLASSGGFSSRQTGEVLQVVQTFFTTSFTTSSNSMTDVTGMSLTITPTSSSSRILLMTSMSTTKSSSSYAVAFQWVRGSTPVGIGTLGSTGPNYSFSNTQFGGNSINNVSFHYLDSPSTTSATTYKLQVRVENSGGTWGLNNNPSYLNGGSDVYHGAYTSTITAMEIAG